MNIFKFSLKISGFPMNDAAHELRYIRAKSDKSFADWQLEKRWEIFNFHLNNNQEYRAFIGNIRPNVWEDIPILTKSSIQKPLNNRLSKGFRANNVFVSTTSGSTGTPFYFAKDRFCHAMTWTLIADRYSWHGINIFKDKQARFYHISVNLRARLRARIKDFARNRYRLNVLDLSDQIQGSSLKKIINGNFDYINGYSVSLVVFAKYLLKIGIVLKSVSPSIRNCIVTSGILTEEDRKIISEALGVAVINEYGASEISIIAFEDPDFEWVVSDEEIFVEVVDENGHTLPKGMEGRLLVTSLYNKAMPFIRYDIGDIAILGKSKNGKNSVLKSLIGRSNDYLLLKNGKKVTETIIEQIISPILWNNIDLSEFLIRQWDYDKFSFEYVSNIEIEMTKQMVAIAALEKYLNHSVKFDFIKRIRIERTDSRKLKYFERMF